MSDEVMATFIFTDLVGSTALASRVGPDAADAIRTAHFGALRGVIDSLGGTEVKNLGDGLMVMFTSARRAVACAVGMQQAIEVHNRRAEEPLSIRVGVAVGEATLEDGDYFGTPVIEAARLCAKCDDDQILVTSTVVALAGKGIAQDTRALGGLELKGLPEQVDTHEVLWEPETVEEHAVVLPGRVSAVLAGAPLGFFGRTDELATIVDVAKTARADQRMQLVAIAGEPGMGKTTLAARAVHDLTVHDPTGAGDVVVAFGGCSEGLLAPFQPWIEVVRGLVGSWDPSTVEAHIAARGHTLGDWVPELAVPGADVVASSDAASDQLLLFSAVTDVLGRSASDRELIVILDDLQWSDAASIQLLRHVLTHQASTPVLIIATYRDSDLSASDPLTGFLADMRRETNVTRIALDGFSDTEIVEVMEAAAGHDLTDPGVALAHTLRRETRGNPFFTSAMLRHLLDNGAIAQNAAGRMELSAELDQLGLPASVREVVAHRVDRLGDDTVTVLNVAAVIGLRFDFDLVVELVELNEDTVLGVLEEATNAALVEEDRNRPGQFAFVHGLVREALYGDLSATRRRRLHRRIAEALEAGGGSTYAEPALLATHFIAATRPHDADKAIHYAVSAGDAAMAALAPADAHGWYRQALELFDDDGGEDPAMRCDLETKLGDAMRKAGDGNHRELLLHAARLAEELDDDERSAAVALALAHGGFLFTPTEDPERLAVIERALGLLADDDIANKVLLSSIMATETGAAKVAERRAYAEQAVTLARASGDDRLLLSALPVTTSAMAAPADHERLAADAAWAVEAADRIGNRGLQLSAYYMMLGALAVEGRTAERAALVARGQALAGETGTLSQRAYFTQAEITLLLYRAEMTRAEELANEIFEAYTAAGASNALLFYGSFLYVIREIQGRSEELVDLFVDVARRDAGVTTASAAAAFMLCDLGRLDEARGIIDFSPETIESYPLDIAWSTGMRCLAHCVTKLDEPALAELIYERLLPYRHLFAYTGISATGSLEQPLGELAAFLGHLDDAVAHFRAAVDANGSAGALYWEAQTRLDLAETLRSRNAPGDADEADELITAAAECARSYGFAGLERRIDTLR